MKLLMHLTIFYAINVLMLLGKASASADSWVLLSIILSPISFMFLCNFPLVERSHDVGTEPRD